MPETEFGVNRLEQAQKRGFSKESLPCPVGKKGSPHLAPGDIFRIPACEKELSDFADKDSGIAGG
jgi:hypothetical protein